jgi:hypothetical protein
MDTPEPQRSPLSDYLRAPHPGTSEHYVVLPKPLVEAMPLPWQIALTQILAEFHQAFAHLDWPEYRIVASRKEKLVNLDEDQLAEAGYLVEIDADGEVVYRDRIRRRIDNPEHTEVLVSILNPVPGQPSNTDRGKPSHGGPAQQAMPWLGEPALPHDRSDNAPPGGAILTATDTMFVSMYLSDEGAHPAVETAVEMVLTQAGLVVVDRDDPVFGSWFRRVRAGELGAMAAHAADSRLVLAHDAQVTSTMLQNLGPVLTALQSTKEAVLRIGAVLIVKLDDQLVVHQLTAAQQLQLDHQPHLAMAPHEILAALRLGEHPEDGLQDGHRPDEHLSNKQLDR